MAWALTAWGGCVALLGVGCTPPLDRIWLPRPSWAGAMILGVDGPEGVSPSIRVVDPGADDVRATLDDLRVVAREGERHRATAYYYACDVEALGFGAGEVPLAEEGGRAVPLSSCAFTVVVEGGVEPRMEDAVSTSTPAWTRRRWRARGEPTCAPGLEPDVCF